MLAGCALAAKKLACLRSSLSVVVFSEDINLRFLSVTGLWSLNFVTYLITELRICSGKTSQMHGNRLRLRSVVVIWRSILLLLRSPTRHRDVRLWLNHTTKTANMKKALLLVSTLTKRRCAAK